MVYHNKLKDDLAEWIDTDNLAEVVIEAMREVAEPEEMTLEMAKNIWLNFLETELNDGIARCIKYPRGL